MRISNLILFSFVCAFENVTQDVSMAEVAAAPSARIPHTRKYSLNAIVRLCTVLANLSNDEKVQT